MTLLRSVRCAWCSAEMKVAAPNVGRDGYFLLPRQCRDCAGNNLVELTGSIAQVKQVRRTRRRINTHKIPLPRRTA
ncbi:MAG TPA: hypothetical protein VFF06_23430 [Polyangia bacterium]|nr:hypothetical protein [Polyangia bacterium]